MTAQQTFESEKGSPQDAAEPTVLRGITWDHPRAIDSIRRATAEYRTVHPNVTVEWVARPLHEFENLALEQLADNYDVIAFDHPFVGSAAATGALAPLDSILREGELAGRSAEYVGQSFGSYEWNAHIWALPVDAACMVSASRRSQLAARDVPRTWAESITTMRGLGARSSLIAANPTHLWGTFLSLCHAISVGDQDAGDAAQRETPWWAPQGIDSAVAVRAVELLREVISVVDPRSLHLDPVSVLDDLAGAGPAVYTPLVFGYSTYALDRVDSDVVCFRDAPSVGHSQTGSLTGGVGLGVSARSRHVRETAEFVAFATSGAVQSSAYAAAGGQPAHAAAWQNAEADRRLNGFFSGTIRTMERSFVRPRDPGYPQFQQTASHDLHQNIVNDAPAERIASRLNEIWAER